MVADMVPASVVPDVEHLHDASALQRVMQLVRAQERVVHVRCRLRLQACVIAHTAVRATCLPAGTWWNQSTTSPPVL